VDGKDLDNGELLGSHLLGEAAIQLAIVSDRVLEVDQHLGARPEPALTLHPFGKHLVEDRLELAPSPPARGERILPSASSLTLLRVSPTEWGRRRSRLGLQAHDS
jgi:hypothetical protein